LGFSLGFAPRKVRRLHLAMLWQLPERVAAVNFYELHAILAVGDVVQARHLRGVHSQAA